MIEGTYLLDCDLASLKALKCLNLEPCYDLVLCFMDRGIILRDPHWVGLMRENDPKNIICYKFKDKIKLSINISTLIDRSPLR